MTTVGGATVTVAFGQIPELPWVEVMLPTGTKFVIDPEGARALANAILDVTADLPGWWNPSRVVGPQLVDGEPS